MADARPLLPTFFVIGAPKAGTTSLHHALGAHPEIAMTSVKEPFVFATPGFRRELGRYAELLAPDAAQRGESSTVYTQFPHYGDVASRIHEVLPGARFIYLVRDPIDRAVAHYRQHAFAGKESRPLGEALSDFAHPASAYVCASRYATQLQVYLRHFDAERILVMDQRDLLERPQVALARAFRFLGVDPEFRSPAFARKLNAREDQRVATWLGAHLRLLPGFATARRLPLPAALREPLRRTVSRPIAVEELDPALRDRIAEALLPEVEWLRQFTGLAFSHWSL